MLEGRIENGVHRLPIRVFYEDTDFSGYVYHANYLKFCERARSDFIRLIGFDQNTMFAADTRTAFVVRRMVCDFLKPARFDDVLVVESRPGALSGARFMVAQAVKRGEDTLFTAEVTAVLIDGRGRPTRIPPEMTARFQAVVPDVTT